MSDYGFTHQGQVYTPNQTPVTAAEADDRNTAIDAAVLASWRACPDHIVAYYQFAEGCRAESLQFHSARTLSDCHVTTWLGAKIGTITRAKVYRHNFGGRMVSLRMIGTNGAEYHGRASWDWGNVITLHKVRGGRS